MNRLQKYALRLFLTCLLSAQTIAFVNAQGKKDSINTGIPNLINTCLFTGNVNRLVEFYESILQMKANRADETYASFETGVGVLAIFSLAAQEKYIPGSTEGLKNGTMVLEFKVADVDAEFERLQGLVKVWVKPPTTQPWGSRSIYFRDPDGNLVDFFTIVKTR
jgi:catechol 2,3-dioxygenase-like lactoylglutathione lyase family enzyme